MPGAAVPDDMKVLSAEHIAELLCSGNWSIDCYENDTPLYYLRPATLDGQYDTFDFSWGGQCVFLGENGCQMSFEDRPLNCRMLIPNPESPGNCSFPDDFGDKGKLFFANHWINHQEMLIEAARRAD